MSQKGLLKYWYPIDELDIVKRSNLEYKSGLILLLSILCGLCTLYYTFYLELNCSSANLCLSMYFFSIPILMKKFGRWSLFGMAVCIGWTIDNIIVGRCSPKDAISLSFYQSLIPSYFILASEEYVFGGFFASFLLMFSLPYEYQGLYEQLNSVPDSDLRSFIKTILERTQTLNSGHLLAVFGLTMWMHTCSNNEFKLMNKLLEETKQAKQAAEMFFAAFSHEFRNPLNSLLGSLELLKDDLEEIPDCHKEYISTAVDCGEMLSNLINNVLDVSKIQAQMFQPQYSRVQPRAILHKIFNVCKTICIRKGLTLILEIDKNLPEYLMLDGNRLNQVLINIISNAIKFTEDGFVKIKVTWKYLSMEPTKEYISEFSNYACVKPRKSFQNIQIENVNMDHSVYLVSDRLVDRAIQTENKSSNASKRKQNYALLGDSPENFKCHFHNESKGTFVIQIQDSGIGITEENIKKIFTPFMQANSGISKLYGGTGLGLWISKTIMNVYKGDVTVRSEINRGSTFTIEQNCNVFIQQETTKIEVKPSPESLHVLLIDNLHTKKNKNLLEENGVKVTICMSAVIALQNLEIFDFNLVFIGLNFCRDDSFNVINRVKKFEKQKKIPIVVLVPENLIDLVCVKEKSFLQALSPLSHLELNRILGVLDKKKDNSATGLVLILDDDHFILDVLSRILEKESIPHLTYAKGFSLIDAYKKKYKETGLVMLDANLDDISGYEVSRAIRKFEESVESHKVPIVCVSGDTDKEHFSKCKEVGITETCKFYLVTKPVKREDYIYTIKKYIS